jgi:hypothetical protein
MRTQMKGVSHLLTWERSKTLTLSVMTWRSHWEVKRSEVCGWKQGTAEVGLRVGSLQAGSLWAGSLQVGSLQVGSR